MEWVGLILAVASCSVLANLDRAVWCNNGTGEFNASGNPAMDKRSIQVGVEIVLLASCYRHRRYKRRADGPLGSYVDVPANHAITNQVEIRSRPNSVPKLWPR